MRLGKIPFRFCTISIYSTKWDMNESKRKVSPQMVPSLVHKYLSMTNATSTITFKYLHHVYHFGTKKCFFFTCLCNQFEKDKSDILFITVHFKIEDEWEKPLLTLKRNELVRRYLLESKEDPGRRWKLTKNKHSFLFCWFLKRVFWKPRRSSDDRVTEFPFWHLE